MTTLYCNASSGQHLNTTYSNVRALIFTKSASPGYVADINVYSSDSQSPAAATFTIDTVAPLAPVLTGNLPVGPTTNAMPILTGTGEGATTMSVTTPAKATLTAAIDKLPINHPRRDSEQAEWVTHDVRGMPATGGHVESD